MMELTFEFRPVVCAECGHIFAITESFFGILKNNEEKEMYCPVGHTMTFSSLTKDLKQELDKEKTKSKRLEEDLLTLAEELRNKESKNQTTDSQPE